MRVSKLRTNRKQRNQSGGNSRQMLLLALSFINEIMLRAGYDGDVSTDAEASVSTLDLGGGGRFLGRAQPFTKSDRNREEASP